MGNQLFELIFTAFIFTTIFFTVLFIGMMIQDEYQKSNKETKQK